MSLKGKNRSEKTKIKDYFLHKEMLKKLYSRLMENVSYGQQISRTGSWTHDIQKDEIFFTNEVYNILECSPEEFDGKLESYYPFIHPEDLERVRKALQEAYDGKEYDIEYRIITGSGTEKYVHERTKAVSDDNHNPIKMIGILQDITEQKLREKHLEEIGDDFSLAQRVAGVGSWKYDVIKDEFYGTDEMYRIYGIEHSDFNNDFANTIKLIHPDDQAKVQEALNKHMMGQACTVEFRIPQQDGTNKYVVGKAKPIFDSDGQVIAILGTLQDITRNKLLEQELMKSYKIINQAQALAHIGSWEMDITDQKTCWSEEARRILGLDTSCKPFEEFMSRVHPEDVQSIDDILKNPPEKPMELEFRIIRDDGSVRDVYELLEFIFNEDGKPVYIYGTVQDISEKKELQKEVDLKQQKIRTMQRRFDALIKESVDVFEILDADGRLLYISEASEKVIGYKPEERLGKKIYEFYEDSDIHKLSEMVRLVLNDSEKRVTSDVLFRTKDGKEIYLEVFMQNFLHDPAIEGIVVNFRDITNRVMSQKRITYLSTHDPVTGLPNKLYFGNRLKELQDASDPHTRFALFMLDIDSATYIMNTLGYKIAEKYLIKIAVKLKHYCKTKYFICRYSDNRFVLIIEGTHAFDEYDLCVKEVYELFSQTVKVDKYELDVDISMGISICQDHEQDMEQLVKRAEAALFLAKNEGKNRYKFYSSDISIESYKHFVLRNDLRRAVESNQLIIHYQPLVSLGTHEVLAAEALIRWNHPEWGMVSPGEFISMAEETGYIIKIGDWLLKEVCRNYKQWVSNGLPGIKIAINYSSMQFFEADFVDKIKRTIDEYDLNPHFLIMEITESILIKETDKVISDIKRLQSLGIQIALDDFGTGYSSLAYLASFSIDIIKIDGSFIRHIHDNETSTIIIKNIIKIAQELRIKLVAEHIETLEQLSFLTELKCYTGQGYLFSKPVPSEVFEKVLANKFCSPIVSGDTILPGNRRKMFRIKFSQLLEAQLTILEIKGRKVNVGNTKVLVKNIGPGGCCFVSNIRLPIDRSIVLQFAAQLIGKELKVCGGIVWGGETGYYLYEYGVEFRMDENQRTDLVKILNRVQISMKNDILFADGSFTSRPPHLYFRH